MPGAGKLSDGHVDFIHWKTAEGESAQAIADLLAEGPADADGHRLEPVEITRHGVRYRQTTDKGEAAIEEWRRRLYGEALVHKIAWPGWRLGQLQKLYAESLKGLLGAETPGERRRWLREAGRLLGQAQDEMGASGKLARRFEGPSTGERHLHLHAGSDSDARERLERRLVELAGELQDAELLDLPATHDPTHVGAGAGSDNGTVSPQEDSTDA